MIEFYLVVYGDFGLWVGYVICFILDGCCIWVIVMD